MEAATFSLSAVDHGLDDSAIASISFMLSALPLRPSAATARICQVVKSRFLKLNSSHIEYVLEAMNKNPSDIRNIRAYLLTALYNASLTIDNYYSALVNHDFYGQDRSAGLKKPKTYDYSLCEDTL
jgi:hypothetical protein